MGMYGAQAVATAMKMQEIMLRAMAGQLSWISAAQILRKSPRTLRRIRAKYRVIKTEAFFDGRRRRPSKRRVPARDVQKILDLYRGTYQGFNVRHFVEKLQENHGVEWSYSSIKTFLQESGLVKKNKRKGPHRTLRPRKECFGQMLQIDGSEHTWLENQGKHTLIVVIDDATSKLLHAELFEQESRWSIFKSLQAAFQRYGLSQALYCDRASWAFYTPEANGKVDPKRKTKIGELMHRLGIELIPAYSAQAKGRVERSNRTLQDRLVKELQLNNIREIEAANHYIETVYLPNHNQRFAKKPASEESVFIKLKGPELFEVMTLNEDRRVNQDNTVRYQNQILQIPKQKDRTTCANLQVTVKKHTDKTLSIYKGPRLLARYDRNGNLLSTFKRKGQVPSGLDLSGKQINKLTRKESTV